MVYVPVFIRISGWRIGFDRRPFTICQMQVKLNRSTYFLGFVRWLWLKLIPFGHRYLILKIGQWNGYATKKNAANQHLVPNLYLQLIFNRTHSAVLCKDIVNLRILAKLHTSETYKLNSSFHCGSTVFSITCVCFVILLKITWQ